MHGIFINYRREDVTGFVRSVFDHLRSHFGDSQVFMDVSNIVGTWYDNFGTPVQIQQQGNQFKAVIYDPYSGVMVYDSNGTVNGSQLNYQWQTNQSSGTGVGTMQADMRHIDIVATDNLTDLIEAIRLHKEHMPGQ